MLKPLKVWRVKETNEPMVNEIAQAAQCSTRVAQLLYNRGYTSPEQARSFLHSDALPFHDPYLMLGMDKVVERITEALEKEEKILVFGDYDADGVSSTSLLVLALRELGALVSYYIPDRFREGYGPNIPAIERAQAEGVSLVITVDTGISAIEVAAHAKTMGLDYIVTDHHEPPPTLPDAYAILNPKQPGCTYPFKSLAGVGVAFKLVQGLLDEIPAHLLDLAAVGTVSDLVPLEDENRCLVKEGLKSFRSYPKPGLQALLTVSGQSDLAAVNSEVIGFQLGPRLNAAGRLQHASLSADLLMTEDYDVALRLAEEVNQLNDQRKNWVEDITVQAIALVEKMPEDERDFIIVAQEEWHEGVLGIVASRLVETYYKPTLVLSINAETGMAKGSARSIEGFDLFQALSTSRDLLPHFGGHEMAAGLSLLTTDIEELRDRMNRFARQVLTPDLLVPKVDVDAVLRLDEVTTAFIEEMAFLEPYGEGNPKPKFVFENVSMQDMKQIGANKDHLKLSLTDSGKKLDAISFRSGHLIHHMTSDASLSVVGELGINEWNGFRKPQVFIEDFSIEDWQLFDLRGQEKWQEILNDLDQETCQILYFSPESLSRQKVLLNNILFYEDVMKERVNSVKAIILLDLPESLEQLSRLLRAISVPERIYLVFDQQDQHFENVPSREQFKLVFGLLYKHQNVTVEKLKQWAQYKGWSTQHVEFILKVFLELEFVKMNEDIILPASTSVKRPLTDAPAYQKRLAQAEVEELLLYSPRHAVKEWLDKQINGRLAVKEDILS